MTHTDTVPKARTDDSARQRVNIFRDWPVIVSSRRIESGKIEATYKVEWQPRSDQPCPFRSYPDGERCQLHPVAN